MLSVNRAEGGVVLCCDAPGRRRHGGTMDFHMIASLLPGRSWPKNGSMLLLVRNLKSHSQPPPWQSLADLRLSIGQGCPTG